MRKLGLVGLALLVVGLAVACGSTKKTTSTATPASNTCAKDKLNLISAPKLTIGTDNPAYPPWYGGGTPKGSQWKINDPTTGQGFESAVAYAVAKQLGFAKSEVVW